MIRLPVLLVGLMLSGCSAERTAPATIERPPPIARDTVAPQILADARRAEAAADRVVAEPDLSNADLIRLLELARRMRDAVRLMRAHRTAAHIEAARAAIRELREFRHADR